MKERVPEAAPATVGVKVIATVQVPAAATGLEIEQVVPEVAMAKGPVVAMAVKVRLEMPVFVTVTVCAGLVVPTGSEGNVGAGDKLATGPVAAVPVPPNVTVCVMFCCCWAKEVPWWVMSRLAVRVPAPSGVKATVIVHCAPAASVEPQVFAVRLKSAGFVPASWGVARLTALLLLFARVTDCGVLVVP